MPVGVCATAHGRLSAVISGTLFATDDASDGALPASVDTHVATVALPIKLNAAELLFGGARDKLTVADAERDREWELEPARDADGDDDDDGRTKDELAVADAELDGEPESNAVEFAEKARPAQIKTTAVSMAARILAEKKRDGKRQRGLCDV